MPHFSPKLSLWLAASAGVVLVVVAIAFSLVQTRQSLVALQSLDTPQAAVHARQALPVSQILHRLTFGQVKAIEAWTRGLTLITDFPTVITDFSPFGGTEAGLEENLPPSTASLTHLSQESLAITQLLDRSWVFSTFWPEQSQRVNTVVTGLETVVTDLMTGQHTYVVVFQNTEELRPTGGFMGTYALVTLTNGQITDLNIQDIYEPDGQFKGYVEAPPGVKEYLSSGNGLRLPDANWWSDWPSSAQKVLPFFALGNKQAAEGVIAINLTVAENILQVVGPTYVPDYQTTVTAENLAQVARADREHFFPGSQSKPHFLSSLFNQLKFKLGDLTADQKKALGRQLLTALRTKNVQLYSNQEGLQKVFEKYNFAGQATTTLAPQNPDWYLYLTEANVGINKANRNIKRSVDIELGDYRSVVTVKFNNQNPSTQDLVPSTLNLVPSTASGSTHLHYINYQRLLVLPGTEVKSVVFNNQPLEKWSSAPIRTSTGEEFTEIGFLVEVPENSEAMLSVEVTHPQLPAQPLLLIQKQSGLPPTPYTLTLAGQTKQLLLEQDEVLAF